MNTLQEQLDRLIKRKGEQDPLVQMLRNQILAEETGKTFGELYTGNTQAEVGTKLANTSFDSLPMQGQRPKGLRIDEELLPAFACVLRGLTNKRNTKQFDAAVADLSVHVHESVIADFGDHIGEGIPLHRIRADITDKGMIEMLGLEEDKFKQITDAEKATFAHEMLKYFRSNTDADICPGFWLVPINDGVGQIFIGFSVTGYSFSGIEWRQEGAYLSEADFIKMICCDSEMFFEGCLCVKGVPTSLEEIDDITLLRLIWGD